MAAVFTELRVRLVINILTIVLFLISCSQQHVPAEFRSYSIDSVKLKNVSGVLFNGKSAFTGIVYALSESGDSIFSRCYSNGLEEGVHKLWYPNGRLQEIRQYKQGKKTGASIGFWPDGNKRYRYYFRNDLYEGIQYEWYGNKQLYSKKKYIAGYESGVQQSWNPDGSIKSNYEARNGRNYGNIGKKNCYSVWKDTAFVSVH